MNLMIKYQNYVTLGKKKNGGVVLEKLDGARGWHPNLAKTQLSGNLGSGETISRKWDEGPHKNKNKKREEEENLLWSMTIAAVGRGVGVNEGINP